MTSYLDIATTPSVAAAQAAHGSREMNQTSAARRVFDRIGESEAAFIAARDSFYLATVSPRPAGPISSIAAAPRASSR